MPYSRNAVANDPSRKYLSARFVVARIVAQIAGQNIGGDGGNLQADEDHDQLIGGSHDGLADDAEQDQRVEFAAAGVFAAQIVGGAEHGQQADADHQNAEKGGESVDHQHVLKRRAGIAVGHDRADQRRGQAERPERREDALLPVAQHRFQKHDQRRRPASG